MPYIFSIFLLCIVFFLLWLWCRSQKNYSYVDAAWALGLTIPLIVTLFLSEGNLWRKLILFSMACTWSLRLGLHLLARIRKQHPVEDARYANLRKLWGTKANRNFFFVFLANSLLIFILSLPYTLPMHYEAKIQFMEYLGITVFTLGVLGETLADYQLKKFKQSSQSGVCATGLWYYSRHPNYFFEFVLWLGVWLFSCAHVHPLATLHAPLIMLFLLLRVTGIPPAEKALLISKGNAYSHYQKATSSFIPWFPKSTAS